MRLNVTHNSPTSVLWCTLMAGFHVRLKVSCMGGRMQQNVYQPTVVSISNRKDFT